jgi:hypothetical protein
MARCVRDADIINSIPQPMACFYLTILSHADNLDSHHEGTIRPPCLPGPTSRPAGRHGPIGERTRSSEAFELSEHNVSFVDDLTLASYHWTLIVWCVFWSNSLDPSCLDQRTTDVCWWPLRLNVTQRSKCQTPSTPGRARALV